MILHLCWKCYVLTACHIKNRLGVCGASNMAPDIVASILSKHRRLKQKLQRDGVIIRVLYMRICNYTSFTQHRKCMLYSWWHLSGSGNRACTLWAILDSTRIQHDEGNCYYLCIYITSFWTKELIRDVRMEYVWNNMAFCLIITPTMWLFIVFLDLIDMLWYKHPYS